MNLLKKFNNKLTGLTNAIARFPLTTLFLLSAAVINAYAISTEKDVAKILITFVVGAFLSAVCQTVHERFFFKASARFVLMGAAALLTAGYYLIIMPAPQLGVETEIRTAVALFALLIAFIWVPVIHSKISFNKSFMIAFKSFFHSLFFSVIIFAGISMILTAFNLLILAVDISVYPHTANIVFVVFAPMYFLSMIPVYSESDRQTEIAKAAHCPKFLEVLLSYIVIPLLAVFTFILVVYILKNIGGKFWTDNLLEPMLVSYAITVIFVYILVSEIENKFTSFFRKIFPKVLVPIILFQIASSILSLAETGVTHTRYYVILFGIYAAAAGILLSFLPVRKNGVLAGLLIIFAAVSIVPPVDAFTISRTSQTNTLKNVLMKNHMLKNNKIQPNGSISGKDKKIITDTVDYLYMMGYTKKIDWLPSDFNAYDDFYAIFGFNEYQKPPASNQGVFLSLENSAPIPVTGFDVLVQTEIDPSGGKGVETICDIKKSGKTYTLLKDYNQNQIILKGDNGQELIHFNTQEIYDKFHNYQSTKGQISADEATFIKENDRTRLKIVAQNVGIETDQLNNAVLYVFVEIK